MEGPDGRIIPDYGLDDLALDDEGDLDATFADEDTFNDDTLGSGGGLGDYGLEDLAGATLEMSRMHEQFLAGELGAQAAAGAGAGGFFGDMGLGGGDDFLLENEPTFELPALEDELDLDGLSLDAGTAALLESPSPRGRPAAAFAAAPPPPSSASGRGLKVSGLPSSLNEAEAKQLLTHFGPLAHFELRKGAASSTAFLRYQDASITDSAKDSIHGIPLGGSTLTAEVVDLTAHAPPPQQQPPPALPSGADLLAMLGGAGGAAGGAAMPAGAMDAAALEARDGQAAATAASHAACASSWAAAATPWYAAYASNAGRPYAATRASSPGAGMPPRGPPPGPGGPMPAMPPPGPQQLAQLQAMAQQMQLPPPVRAALAQMAHLPPPQQQALLSQIMAHHARMQQQMAALQGQRPGPPPPGAQAVRRALLAVRRLLVECRRRRRPGRSRRVRLLAPSMARRRRCRSALASA